MLEKNHIPYSYEDTIDEIDYDTHYAKYFEMGEEEEALLEEEKDRPEATTIMEVTIDEKKMELYDIVLDTTLDSITLSFSIPYDNWYHQYDNTRSSQLVGGPPKVGHIYMISVAYWYWYGFKVPRKFQLIRKLVSDGTYKLTFKLIK